jgi:glycosyltransferase involved in cell wall biosynthesis
MTMISTYIICVSNTVKNHVVNAAGIPPKKLSVIYSGSDLSRFSPAVIEPKRDETRRRLGISKQAFVVGCISRIVDDKGHEYLLDAAPKIIERCGNVFFLLVGEGNKLKPLREQAERLGITDRILFTGPRSDIPDLLSTIDLFVYPSLHEAFSLSIIEAMAAARPIICSNYTAIPELLTSGKCGIIVPLRDSAAIADAVIDLYNNPAKRESLANTAFEKSRTFSMEQTARSLEALYRSLLDK